MTLAWESLVARPPVTSGPSPLPKRGGPGRSWKGDAHLLKNGRASGVSSAPDWFESSPPHLQARAERSLLCTLFCLQRQEASRAGGTDVLLLGSGGSPSRLPSPALGMRQVKFGLRNPKCHRHSRARHLTQVLDIRKKVGWNGTLAALRFVAASSTRPLVEAALHPNYQDVYLTD